MDDYSIEFPDDFEREAPIIEAKGWFGELTIRSGDQVLRPTFYGPVRLAQTVGDDVSGRKAYSA